MFPTDLIEIVGTRENFSEVASIKFSGVEVAQQEFPDIKLNESEGIAYFPFRLCHSMPQINKRGRAFMPKVLANSFASACDQLIDVEHMVKSLTGSAGVRDRICGFIKAIKYDPSSVEVASALSNPIFIPPTPLPVRGLGAVWTRSEGMEEIIKEHNQNMNWNVSMECGHDWEDAYFYYENEFIPLKDCDKGMLECVQTGKVLPFKGRPLAVCLGGIEGKVEFWGAAVTRTPADPEAKIEGKMFSLVSGQSREVASKNIFFMPLYEYSVPAERKDRLASEVASKIEEIAAIEILGETEPAGIDGHRHFVLTDMTILPAGGHEHYCPKFEIVPGTNPLLTGVTGTHDIWIRKPDGTESRDSHSHLIKIPLKKKFKTSGENDDGTVVTPPSTEVGSINVNDTGKQEIKMKIAELASTFKEQNELIGQLLVAKDDTERAAVGSKLTVVQKKLGEFTAKEIAEEAINEAITERVASGELLTKDAAEKLVEEKAAQIRAEAEAQVAKVQKENERLEIIRAANLNVEYTVPGVDQKVSDFLAGIAFDEAGDKNFKAQVTLLSKIPDALLTPASAGTAASATAGTEAASSNDFAGRVAALANTKAKAPENASSESGSNAHVLSNGEILKSRAGRSVFSPLK